ncbi:MAG: EAL domain-containing protein [Sulfobacillus sp.]|nr:EAL domain-containing protein [Sulfobacillus sp.]
MATTNRMVKRFQQLMETDTGIRTVFQPVMPLMGSAPIGFEALSRGPSPWLAKPAELFRMARELGQSAILDRLCFRTALKNFRAQAAPESLLFINVLPESLESRHIAAAQVAEWAHQADVSPKQIVLEITEEPVHDWPGFMQAVDQFRSYGMRLALDDVGSGHSNFVMLSDLLPDYVKLDWQFVRLTRIRPVRQLLVEALVRFADQIGSQIVAEGIESREDAEVFRLLGVPLGQGFYYHQSA